MNTAILMPMLNASNRLSEGKSSRVHNRTAPTLRPKLALLLLLATCCLPNTGCYTYHVYQTGGPEGREMGNQPSTEWTHSTLHSFAWGLVRQDLPVDCQLGNGQRLGIEEVKIETNLGYALFSVGTLGIWVPIEVAYRCAKPPVPTDVLR